MPEHFYRKSTDGKLEVKLEPMTAQDLLHPDGVVADGSVDLLLTDPPYIISRETGFTKTTKSGKLGGNPQYAVNYEFGDWDTEDGFSMADLERSLEGSYRALRNNGVAIVFFDLWKASELAEIMKNIGFIDVTMIEWVKSNAVPINSRKNYLSNAREIAIVGRKFDKDAADHRPVVSINTEPRGAFSYPIYSGKDRFHPTQKSLPLFEQLILAHSEEGDTVMDCFSGSGTTAVAAIRTGRSFVGAEPDCAPESATQYFQRSAQRLDVEFSAAETKSRQKAASV